MSKAFLQLKRSWNLPEETSVDELLSFAQKKLQSDPDNPEIVYTVAELQRQLGKTDDAKSNYQKAVKLTDKRTHERGQQLEYRLEKKRDHTRAKFLLSTFLPLIFLLLGAGILWKTLTQPEALSADADPTKFAFTQWLAKQQMVKILTTLQQNNPELTFDFTDSSVNAQSPIDLMQSLMKAGSIGNLKRDKESTAKSSSGEEGDGRPPFQCSLEAPVDCAEGDTPNMPGKPRREVLFLASSFSSILENEHDCEKLEKSVQAIDEQLQWRKSEKGFKADLVHIVAQCFSLQKNTEKALEYARKLQCTKDDNKITSIYWFKVANYYRTGDLVREKTSYQCFLEAVKYLEETNNSPTNIAISHRDAGALAWLYFDDLDTAIHELGQAHKILKDIPAKTSDMVRHFLTINFDLMETYVIANIDLDTFQELLEDINSSGQLTDGYKQIKDTLSTIYFIQNKNYEAAKVPLNIIANRFKSMPEYICSWTWSSLAHRMEESISDKATREQVLNLIDATNCYIKHPMQQRINKANKVLQWLKSK